MNQFYNMALHRASRVAGHRGRMIVLLIKLGSKMKHVSWKEAAKDLKGKVMVLSRLAHAFATGRYRSVSLQAVATIFAGFIYFINPLDLIPDFAVGIGLTDDFSVLLWVYNSLQKELTKFLMWEQDQVAL